MTVEISAANLELKKFIRPGDNILWGQGTGEPQTLTEALAAQRADLGGVTIYVGAGFSDTIKPEHADHIKMIGFNAVGTTRRLTKGGALQIIPCHIGQVANYIEQGVVPCDVALVQVAGPNEDGLYSYGVINDYTQAMVAKARVVIAEVNDQVPLTYCQGYLKPEDIDVIVKTSRPVIELKTGAPTELDKQIAKFTAEYIDDGTCLQIGIGGVPDAIMQLLLDRKDLGLHTGSVGDGMVELVEKGVLTNARKPFDQGVSVVGGLIGSQRVYAFAHKNKAISMRPSSYTHAATVLSNLPKLVTINTALEIDLSGQVNAEQAGDQYLGGVGGQPEYVRAGHRSVGGHSIMALQSSAKDGTVNKITTRLSTPVVTSPRIDVDVVITEYGAAELRGQPLPERARRLIAIAHPNFRESLTQEAQPIFKRGY